MSNNVVSDQRIVKVVPIRHTLASIKNTYCSFHWACDASTGRETKGFCSGDKCAHLERWTDGSVKCGRK